MTLGALVANPSVLENMYNSSTGTLGSVGVCLQGRLPSKKCQVRYPDVARASRMFFAEVSNTMAIPKIRILCVGKSRDPWLQAALAHYAERSKPFLWIEWVEVSDEEALLRAARSGQPIALDPRGRQLTSEEWSGALYGELEARGELTFLIGGADGFSPSLRALLPAPRMWSLSRLTMTHQVVRVMLAEQLYRAALIHIGHPYHRA